MTNLVEKKEDFRNKINRDRYFQGEANRKYPQEVILDTS